MLVLGTHVGSQYRLIYKLYVFQFIVYAYLNYIFHPFSLVLSVHYLDKLNVCVSSKGQNTNDKQPVFIHIDS